MGIFDPLIEKYFLRVEYTDGTKGIISLGTAYAKWETALDKAKKVKAHSIFKLLKNQLTEVE